MIKPISVFFAGLVIPGGGHALVGKFKTGILFQGCLILLITLTCLTRVITYPFAPLTLFILILSAHILSAFHAWRSSENDQPNNYHAIKTVAFFSLALTTASFLFVSKSENLGINLYYIPSASMEPALQPGDIILVDTWIYSHTQPAAGDIATFHDPIIPKRTLIKRVADVRISPSKEISIFFRGDNIDHSSDSRHFGWINADKVTGKYIRTLGVSGP
jgi:signal peptidase I